MSGTIPLFPLCSFMACTRAFLHLTGVFIRLLNKCKNLNYWIFGKVDESYFNGAGETHRTLILSFCMGRNLIFHIKESHRR